ncbi:uncharacterized protein EHS24_000255 [Apiotrichum porosum]|uniref:BZIP domain-containing protein n=1 Tax=Apiotrichum porosum TaxID=105984 RepID=A0A427Y9C1_9TREE|nr:uncharacterized protein EHS24_000255 [Apiotrichum porosum]RSH87739.1 hypothetical protein EHS24_000255 [Apiotrichum porosum]
MMQSSSSAPHTRTPSGAALGGPDDGDNRSRNAKAQRRHREKRKAHFKALEDSVALLTAQLEEARRQVSAAAYASSRIAYSPESKDVAQLAAENAYLRDENADLRRQLYAVRINYTPRDPGSAGGPLGAPPTAGGEPPKVGPWMGGDIKQEPASGAAPYGVYGVQSAGMVSPPRVGSSSHGRTMSHPGDFVRDPAAEGSTSAPSSYPPPLYQFGTIVGEDKWAAQDPTRHPQRGSSSSSSRSRLLSSSSAPSASPYVQSAPFPTDPRAHALSTHNAAYPVRYESTVYPAVPPPHNLPRSAVGSSSGGGGGPSSSGGYAHGAPPGSGVAYVPRTDGEVTTWGQQDQAVQHGQQQTTFAASAAASTSAAAFAATGAAYTNPLPTNPNPIAFPPNHWREQQPRH